MKKVAIVGAGPGGILMAHYLLRRGDQYQVDIYERRSDPRTVPFATSRTFPITLTDRGVLALRQIPGVEAAVRAISAEITGTVFHAQNGKKRVTDRKKSLNTLDRTRLVMVLLDTLTQNYLTQNYDSRRLNIHFNCACTQVDFDTRTVRFQSMETTTPTDTKAEFSQDYDLLIGADGARSVVRTHFLETELFEFEQKYIPNDYKSIFLPCSTKPAHINLESGKIHNWRLDDGTALLLVHQPDETMSGVLLFPRQNNQVLGLSTPAAVLSFFRTHFPEVGEWMSATEAEAFLQRPVSRIVTIRCNRYHQGDSVLLIGDAAHAVSPALGQGCNAALEDVVLFDRLLNETSDQIGPAIEQFTIRRKADAHALAELSNNTFPSSTPLFVEFVLRERLAKILNQLLPHYFSPSLTELLFEPAIPYSEILHAYDGWVAKVKKENEKVLDHG
jgi:kynurenine 3-monooxygenase